MPRLLAGFQAGNPACENACRSIFRGFLADPCGQEGDVKALVYIIMRTSTRELTYISSAKLIVRERCRNHAALIIPKGGLISRGNCNSRW